MQFLRSFIEKISSLNKNQVEPGEELDSVFTNDQDEARFRVYSERSNHH